MDLDFNKYVMDESVAKENINDIYKHIHFLEKEASVDVAEKCENLVLAMCSDKIEYDPDKKEITMKLFYEIKMAMKESTLTEVKVTPLEFGDLKKMYSSYSNSNEIEVIEQCFIRFSNIDKMTMSKINQKDLEVFSEIITNIFNTDGNMNEKKSL